jgi:hypothetical protein
MDVAGDFVDALLAAPAGVAVLARLEAAQHADSRWWESPVEADPAAVERACRAVAHMTLGSLLSHAIEAAGTLAGPWMSDAPRDLARAYLVANERRPLAETISARFGPQLHAGAGAATQELWLDHAAPPRPTLVRFQDLQEGYSSGEFPWRGLWTVSALPAEAHDGMVGWWEMWGSPITRWRLPVEPSARILEIHRPQDWVTLVERFPRRAIERHSGWELPGPNQRVADLAVLLAVAGQHACRTHVGDHLVPDWPAVAEHHDAVHLSWAGFLTSEGFVANLPDGGVAMLRYWASERTLWLRDVFGEPEPLPAPHLSGRVCDLRGAAVTNDAGLRGEDHHHIEVLLGR